MISLTIHEDEWDILAKNAATATWPEHRFAPQYPDPPAFCLLVALGMVQLANPGPVLLTQAEAECLQKFYKALWLGKIWNPWFLPMPPVPKLEDEIRAMKSRLEIHGLGPRDELEYKMASNAIDALVERHRSFMTLRTLMPLCDNAQLWEMVTKCCARIAKQ